jgi:phospho-N-acetylmuramoyl-pentapeptide-transferase
LTYLMATSAVAFMAVVALLAVSIRSTRQRAVISDDHVSSHTPSATHVSRFLGTSEGGVAIVVALIAAYAVIHVFSGLANVRGPLLVMLVIVGSAGIGFADDWLHASQGSRQGLSLRIRLIAQVAVGLAFSVLSVFWVHTSTTLSLVRHGSHDIQLGSLGWIVLTTLAFVVFSNAVGSTEGMDGLTSGTASMCFVCIAIMGFWQYHNFMIYHVTGALNLALIASAMAGACLGFLWWNAPPARAHMRNTGSYAIGSGLVSLCVLLNLGALLPIIGGLYLVVLLSIGVQAVGLRLFGKRLFRMAPLQYHFEMLGWPATAVLFRFWIGAGLFSALAIGIFYGDYASVGIK